MNNKPMLFVTDDLAEGVYAAGSGSSSGTVDYELRVTFEGKDEYNKKNEYSIIFTNKTDEALSTFSIRLTSNHNITSFTCYDSKLSLKIVNSTTLELTFRAPSVWENVPSGSSTPELNFAVYSDVVPFTLN